MQTLKTAVVVVLLLVVFYGVYEMLNRPPVNPPTAVQDIPDSALGDVEIEIPDFDDSFVDSYEATDDGISGPDSGFEIVQGRGDSIDSQPAGGAFAPTAPPTAPPTGPPGSGSASSMPVDPTVDAMASANSVPAAPSSTAPPGGSMTMADAEVYGTPGGPQMQYNPHMDDPPVPKPQVASSGQNPMGAKLFKQALAKAQNLIDEKDFVSALRTLSVFYKSPELTEKQQGELLDLLDPLAGRVIYSREHLLVRPYTVGHGQTLAEIAQLYSVPYQLLQKINGIDNPNVLLPGSELKVVPGPFHADVDLAGHELTLFVDGLYAGRFPVTLGQDPQPEEGEFHVREKQLGKTYFALNGPTIPADSPENPFGRVWIDLNGSTCIHGSSSSGGESRYGCISLSPRDADDVYSILSVGSKVRILR